MFRSLLLLIAIFAQLSYSLPSQLSNDVETISTSTESIVARDGISCGPLKCPPGTSSCMFTENTTPDLQFIERNSTCSGPNGEKLISNSERVPNESKVHVSTQIVHSVGGNGGNFGDFDEVKNYFQKVEEEMENFWSKFSKAFDTPFFRANRLPSNADSEPNSDSENVKKDVEQI